MSAPRIALAFMVAVSLVGSLVNAENPEERMKMQKAVIGMVGPEKKIDPAEASTVYDFLLIQCIYQTLTRMNGEGSIVADLASGWEISPDGMRYSFKINPLASFSDGTRVTSKDVTYSLARHGWPSSRSVVKNYLSDLVVGYQQLEEGAIPEGVKAKSDSEFEIALKRPYPPFLLILAMPGFSILPADARLRSKYIGSGHLIGTKSSNEWTFKVNDKYAGAKPKLKELSVRNFINQEEVLRALSERSVDVVLGVRNVTSIPLAEYRDYSVFSTRSLSFNHFFFNMKRPGNRSKRFRLLFGQLISTWARNFAGEDASLDYLPVFLPRGTMPPSYYSRHFSMPSQDDLQAAWKARGHTDGLSILIPKGFLPNKFVADLAQRLALISEKVRIEQPELAEAKKLRDRGQYDLVLSGYVGNFPDPDGFLDSIRENNFPGISVGSEGLFQSIERARFEPDSQRRLQLYEKAIRSFEDDWTIIPLFQVQLPVIHNKKILIPETNYRYEAELWNFLWQKEP